MKYDAAKVQELFKKIQDKTATAEELRLFLDMTAATDPRQLMPYEEWEQSTARGVPAPLKEKIILAATKKKTPGIQRYIRKWLPYAAAILLLLAVRLFLPIPWGQQPVYLTATANDGEIKRVSLPDSSIIMLNARSSVRYRKDYPAGSREIFLEGEAFFDVRANDKKPFIVHSSNLHTQVLGTSFNIKSYPGEKLLVGVLTGKVKVADQAGKWITLAKGDKVMYDKQTAAFSNYTEDPKNMSSWQHGAINMDNLTLREVAAVLERWYSVKIMLMTPGIENYVLSGSQTNTSLASTLESICFIYHLQYEQQGQIIKIVEQ